MGSGKIIFGKAYISIKNMAVTSKAVASQMKRLLLIPLAVLILVFTIPVLRAGIFTRTSLPAASIGQLRCEYLVNPMGIGASTRV